MANLAITAVCNQRCAYCFTQDHLEENGVVPDCITVGDFSARLSFLDRSGIDQVRVLGGEPTLHPRFAYLLEVCREQKRRVMVFSNGLMPENTLAYLESLPSQDTSTR